MSNLRTYEEFNYRDKSYEDFIREYDELHIFDDLVGIRYNDSFINGLLDNDWIRGKQTSNRRIFTKSFLSDKLLLNIYIKTFLESRMINNTVLYTNIGYIVRKHDLSERYIFDIEGDSTFADVQYENEVRLEKLSLYYKGLIKKYFNELDVRTYNDNLKKMIGIIKND